MSRTKSEWRRHFLAARQDVQGPTRRACSAAIVERVLALPEFGTSRALLTYRPIGAEVDPEGVGRHAATRGMPVYAAATEAGPVSWSQEGGAALDDASLREAVSDGAIMVLVPGVAFEESLWRLGRGGGFYDRSLAALRATGPVCAVGLAYEAQIAVELPHDGWDQPMDLVATERRLLRAERGGVA